MKDFAARCSKVTRKPGMGSRKKPIIKTLLKRVMNGTAGSSGRRWFSGALAETAPRIRHPKAPLGKPWPVKHLVSYDFPVGSDLGNGELLVEVLRSRGWRFSDKFCHWEQGDDTNYTFWVKEFEATLCGKSPQKLFGKGKGSVERGHRLRELRLPARALWLMGWAGYKVPSTRGDQACYRDDFARTVVKCGDSLPGSPGDYRIAKFPGTECACFKSNLSKAFKGQPWWPRCYNLPEERKELLKELGCQQSYWIAKPKNDYGGHGVRVWRADDPDLRKLVGDSQGKPVSVVQRYLSDPLLIGGYKFHMRIHMVVTSLDPPQAFVQRNGQCLFATQPYTLAQDSLGQSFRAPVHITNMTFNATVANKDNFFRPKPVIGKGQQFRMAHLERLLAKHHPCYSKEMLWGQVLHIAAEIVRYVARAASVRKGGKLQTDRHFELFGMDLMLDRNLNVFMCEVNTDPGLDYPDEIILGEPNPDYDKESGAAFDTWHDTLTLLGLDAKRGKHGQGSLSHWLQVEFPEAAV